MTARDPLLPRRRGRPPSLKVPRNEPSDVSLSKYSLSTSTSGKRSPKNKGKRAYKRTLTFKGEDGDMEEVKSKRVGDNCSNYYYQLKLIYIVVLPARC